MPYTKFLPKTLLKVAGKPIIEHIIDRQNLMDTMILYYQSII